MGPRKAMTEASIELAAALARFECEMDTETTDPGEWLRALRRLQGAAGTMADLVEASVEREEGRLQ